MTGATRGIGRWFSPLRRSSLGIKLAALGAAVTAAVVTVAFWGLGVEIRNATRLSFAVELSRNQRTLQQLEAYDASQLLFAASLITETPSLQYDLSIYRVEANAGGRPRTDLVNTMERELRERLRSVGNDLLIVTDDSGRVFASVANDGVPIARGTSLSGLAAIRRVLDTKAPADSGALGVLRTDAGFFQVAAYPLVQAGITLGSLVLGRRLDSAFVAAARAASDAAIVVTAGRSVVAASEPALNTVGAMASLETRAGDPGAVTVRIGGEEFVAASVSFGETGNREPVRLWLLQPLSRRVAELTTPLRRKFVLFGSLAVLVAMIGAALVAGTVLGPFQRFVRYMRSGAAMEERQGRFDAENEAAELRTLNESFNQLMDSLAAKRRQLEERTAELLAANVVLTDEVSERARVEQALRESQAQLRQSQKLEAIGTLAGGIAHDFNNLITVISGYTQLALMRADPSTPEAADLRQVVEASDRAATLTHQLLAFSRKQVLQPTVLDLAEVAQGIAPMLQRIIGEHIELRLETSAPLARVRADRGQLEQVLLNLAVNARDAMPDGGVLTIATRNVADARSPRDTSRAVTLVVTDTGIGMAAEIRERIFEPFFTTKEPGKGTGLGLSTVYGIVNQSGGTIVVDSAPDRGASFTITLPAAETMGDGAGRVPDDRELPVGTETVLIVEDAEDVRTLARRTLEERGYTVLVARNADEAIEIASARRVDVLLTDIVMPQTSGPQLVARYQSLHAAPLVVYMSGYADDALAQYELDPNVVFLRKPFSPSSLARAIRDALDHARRSPVGGGVPSVPPIESRARRWMPVMMAGFCLALSATPAPAQRGLLLQGILDVEGWSTNATSNLLTRNRGNLAGLARLQAWGAMELLPSLVLYAQGEAATGSAKPVPSSRPQMEQFGLRFGRSERLVVDVGRVTPIIGTFASRHFETRNPLIGEPDGYTLEYPYGVKLSGEMTHADYRVALVSLPTTHANYQPTPTARLRPAVGVGVTPIIGLRIGGSFTVGPYLNSGMDSILPTSTPWADFDQRVAAVDFTFSRGYLETHAEGARGTYEVPGRASPIAGFTYYGEAKYTLSPRFYVAARVERNKYPFIRRTATAWVSRLTDFVDGEAGVGVRLTPSTLLKGSYLADRWWVSSAAAGFRGQGGHAIAIQLSHAFDVMGLLERNPLYR